MISQKVQSRACKRHSVSGRGRNAFSSCPHHRKDDTPLNNGPNSVAILDVICEHKNKPGKWFDDWFVTVIEPTTYEHEPWENQVNRFKDE